MFLNFFQKLDDTISYLSSNSSNEKKFLKSYFLNKKITFVDVGANVGSYSDFLKKNFLVEKAFLFEPSADLCTILKKKFNINNFFINNIAVSNFNNNKRAFYEYELSSQSSLYKQINLYKSFSKLKKKTFVKTRKLDDLISHKFLIDICKIDTQGEDFKVLQGMSSFLKQRKIKLIKIEMCFFKFYKLIEIDYLKIFNFMDKYNYRLITITKIKFKENKILFLDAYFELANGRS